MYYTGLRAREDNKDWSENKLPKCSWCEDTLYDEYYEIEGEIFCKDCLHDYLDSFCKHKVNY